MKTLILLTSLISCATSIHQELAPLPVAFETKLKSYFHRPAGKPGLREDVIQDKLIAVFDWDNTMIKNDVGDATFFWMIEHNLFIKPKTWASTSPFLTKQALQELNRHCPLKTKKTIYLPTDSGDCGKTLLSIYVDGTVLKNVSAWNKNNKTFNKFFVEPSYAWTASLMQGHTPDDLRQIAKIAIEYYLQKPVGSKKRIHGLETAGYLRIYEPMQTLVEYLSKNSVAVWVISASEQHLVEVFAEKVGIPADHVIGIRPVISDGMLTPTFEACGPLPKGNQQIITYRQGKRCWANKIIFKISSPQEQLNSPAPIFFGAGDSDTDLEFLKDSEIKLVINRNKTELLCHALNNQNESWFIVPMFIDPKAKKTTPYDCTAFGLSAQKEL